MTITGGSGSEENIDFLEDEITTPEADLCKYPTIIQSSIVDGELLQFSWLWIVLQLGYFILLVLFLLPSTKTIGWRIVAIIYSVVQLSLAYFILRSSDLLIWSCLFCFVNLIHFIIRISKWRGHFSSDTEQVYKRLFAPLRVSRPQFSQILSCKRNTRILHSGENYATEKVTRVDSLSLVVSGRLLVSQNNRPLHLIVEGQFVDSPEYFGVSTDELFQVTITAVEESKLLVWHRDKLRLTIMSDEFLRVMFDHIIGRDVVRKLIQVSDSVSAPQTNGYSSSQSPAIKQQDTQEESDPMLSDKNKELSMSVNQFGSPSLPFDTNEVWSLTKIEEEMTPV